MAEYHKLLGISEESPDHYRLLGVDRFETDMDVISNAADRQMVYLRTLRNSDAEQLLNEVARARVCLLDRETRSAYDLTLLGEPGACDLDLDVVVDNPVPPLPGECKLDPILLDESEERNLNPDSPKPPLRKPPLPKACQLDPILLEVADEPKTISEDEICNIIGPPPQKPDTENELLAKPSDETPLTAEVVEKPIQPLVPVVVAPSTLAPRPVVVHSGRGYLIALGIFVAIMVIMVIMVIMAMQQFEEVQEANQQLEESQEGVDRAFDRRLDAILTLPSVVTGSNYKQIQVGMSYRDVVAIIGTGGEELSRNRIAGVPGVMEGVTTVMYMWQNSDGSNMNALFQNDKLVQKSQFGLK